MLDSLKTLDDPLATRVADLAMLSSNAYHDPHKIRFDVESLGWRQLDQKDEEIKFADNRATTSHFLSGLAYDIYSRTGTNEVVFAFRGTDNKIDYLNANLAIPPFQFQYRQARKAVGDYLQRNANRNVSVTGHSLGGGLALSVSVHHGVAATVFDSSPRIFDGLGDLHEPALRISIYQQGDILQKLRAHWTKFSDVVPVGNTYVCDYDFGGDNDHRSDILARRILHQAAKLDVRFKALDDALPMSP